MLFFVVVVLVVAVMLHFIVVSTGETCIFLFVVTASP